jgi:hypothetical protein
MAAGEGVHGTSEKLIGKTNRLTISWIVRLDNVVCRVVIAAVEDGRYSL